MVTQQTRRESYELILETLGKRQQMVFDALKEYGPATANELAQYLYERGMTLTAERNNTHPRLNELEKSELIEIIGKRKCSVTGKTCAVYQVFEGEKAQIELPFTDIE